MTRTEVSQENVQEETCPSCNSSSSVIGYSYSEDVYRCNDCDLCFLRKSIRPNTSNDNNWYAELEHSTDEQVQSFFAAMGDAYAAQLRILERLTTGRAILDVGCGIGIFLEVARRGRWSVSGVETSDHAARFAARHFGITYSRRLDDLADATQDVIRLSHVLEHVPEPLGFLAALKRLLKPQGVIMVIVPNREPLCAAVVNRIRAARSSKPKLAGAIYPDMHVLGFSERSLRRLMTGAGFEVLSVSTVSMGSPAYFPLFYDGLLTRAHPRQIPVKTLLRSYLPMFLDNLGNAIGRGQWVVGYFRNADHGERRD